MALIKLSSSQKILLTIIGLLVFFTVSLYFIYQNLNTFYKSEVVRVVYDVPKGKLEKIERTVRNNYRNISYSKTEKELSRGFEGVEDTPTVFPMNVISGEVSLDDEGSSYIGIDSPSPLSGEGVLIGRIYRKESDSSVKEISIKDLEDLQNIFISFYQNGKNILGVISLIEDGENNTITVTLFDDPLKRRFVLQKDTPFSYKDSSGYFWNDNKGLTSLGVGDILIIKYEDEVAKAVEYKAPLLGGAQDTIQVLERSNENVKISFGGVTEVVVDANTDIQVSGSQGSYGLDVIKSGIKTWGLYYNDMGTLRAVLLVLGVPYEDDSVIDALSL